MLGKANLAIISSKHMGWIKVCFISLYELSFTFGEGIKFFNFNL